MTNYTADILKGCTSCNGPFDANNFTRNGNEFYCHKCSKPNTIAPHAPFQDGSKHAANNYCPTCHGDYYQWQQNIQQNIDFKGYDVLPVSSQEVCSSCFQPIGTQQAVLPSETKNTAQHSEPSLQSQINEHYDKLTELTELQINILSKYKQPSPVLPTEKPTCTVSLEYQNAYNKFAAGYFTLQNAALVAQSPNTIPASSLPTKKPSGPSITVEKKLTKKEWEAEQKVQTIKAELDAMISEPLRTPSFWEFLGGMGAFYTESFMRDIRISNKQHEYIEALQKQSNTVSLKQGEPQ